MCVSEPPDFGRYMNVDFEDIGKSKKFQFQWIIWTTCLHFFRIFDYIKHKKNTCLQWKSWGQAILLQRIRKICWSIWSGQFLCLHFWIASFYCEYFVPKFYLFFFIFIVTVLDIPMSNILAQSLLFSMKKQKIVYIVINNKLHSFAMLCICNQ